MTFREDAIAFQRDEAPIGGVPKINEFNRNVYLSTMEQAYLRRVLGDVLVQGLRDTAIADPADPIDFLAKWLLHREEVESQWSRFREEQKHMADNKTEYLANLEAELRRLEAERLAREEEEKKLAEEQARLQAEVATRLKEGEEEEEEKSEEKTETKPPAPPEEGESSTVYSESLSETF
jgi:hypothetical protein